MANEFEDLRTRMCSYAQDSRTARSLPIGSFGCLEWWRGAVSHDPDEVSRTFKQHCTKCDAWNRITVHRLPADGDWDEAHPYFCAACGHQLGTERGFRVSVERDRD
jgi:hypothetical protein